MINKYVNSFLSIALLLGISNIGAMHNHRDRLAPNRVQFNAQIDRECPICFEDMVYGDAQNPRMKLACAHKFHWTCIRDWRAAHPQCPTCSRAIEYVEDQPDPVVQEPTQQLAIRELTQHQRAIMQELVNACAHYQDDDLDILLINAYENPLILVENDAFMALLTAEQKNLVHELIAISIDGESNTQQENTIQAQSVPLIPQEQAIIQGLAQELSMLKRDEIDIVLIDAYTNPYVLVQNQAFINVLNNQQKALIDHLLITYTKRITQ